MNLKKTWTIAAISLTVVVVGAIAYWVINSNDSSEESPDTAAQSEERQKAIQDGDPPTTTVSTTSTTLPQEQEPVVEEEPVEEVTEDPATGTEVDDSTEDPPTTPVSTTSTTLPEEQEPVVEEEPEEEVTEDPETGTEVDDSTDWVLTIPPNPVWLEEWRAALAFYDSTIYGMVSSDEDKKNMVQMWNQLIGDDCHADIHGVCSNAGFGQMLAIHSRRACPKGWSLTDSVYNDAEYDYLLCSHPDSTSYRYWNTYYPAEEADPRGVPRDYWDSNAG